MNINRFIIVLLFLHFNGKSLQDRCVEDTAKRQAYLINVLYPGDQLHDSMRMASQVEEVIIEPNRVYMKDFSPNFGQLYLYRDQGAAKPAGRSELPRPGGGSSLRLTFLLGVRG